MKTSLSQILLFSTFALAIFLCTFLASFLTRNYVQWYPSMAFNYSFTTDNLRTDNVAPLSSSKILCVVPVNVDKLEETTVVNETWGSRCDRIIYVVAYNDTEWNQARHQMTKQLSDKFKIRIPNVDSQLIAQDVLKIASREGWKYLKPKVFFAFKFLAENYLEQYDWFFKADLDTFVIMPNLRTFLAPLLPDRPYYIGCQQNIGGLYNSGGAGYLLSKAALRMLNSKTILQNTSIIERDPEQPEDVWMGQITSAAGIDSLKTVDEEGRHRFLPLRLDLMINPKIMSSNHDWFYKYSKYPVAKGPECCSRTLITFHYAEESDFRTYDYLLNQLNINIVPNK